MCVGAYVCVFVCACVCSSSNGSRVNLEIEYIPDLKTISASLDLGVKRVPGHVLTGDLQDHGPAKTSCIRRVQYLFVDWSLSP